MKDYKKHKFRFNPYLEKLYQSDEPLIIYKVEQGYNIYTHLSKKFILNKKNLNKFFIFFNKKKYKKETDMMVGFFGYELLAFNLGLSLSANRDLEVPDGRFGRPDSLIKFLPRSTLSLIHI